MDIKTIESDFDFIDESVLLVNWFIKSWNREPNSLVPIELLFRGFFVSWISQSVLKVAWSHHIFLESLRRRHLPCWTSWSFLTIAGSWHWRPLLNIRLLINFLSLRNLTCLWSSICFTKWSCWLISSMWVACSGSIIWISNGFSTMKRSSNVIINWDIKILSKRSWQIRIIFRVFGEIWSPF